MRIAIVGSRLWDDEQMVVDFVNALPSDTEIVSGGAVGVDTFAAHAAHVKGLRYTVYKPNWKAYGNVAGFMRNQIIVDNADQVVAFWNGHSKGTVDTIKRAMDAPHITKITIIKPSTLVLK